MNVKENVQKNEVQLEVGDLVKTKYGDFYICSKLPRIHEYVLHSLGGDCWANGSFDTIEGLRDAIKTAGYLVYSKKKYSLKLEETK